MKLVGDAVPRQCHQGRRRPVYKAKVKWVRDVGLDRVVEADTDLRAVCLLKDAIKRSSAGFLALKLSSAVLDYWQRVLGVSVPVLRFLRLYPRIFNESPHPRYPSLPCFRLTDAAAMLHSQEQSIHQAHELQTVERLCRVLMMTKNRMVPMQSIYPLRWDLGLPFDFDKTLIQKYPDHFRVTKGLNGIACLSLVQWHEEFAVSALQRSKQGLSVHADYQRFKSGRTPLAFPLNFPERHGRRKVVKAWMEEFQKLPYISPYQDCGLIDPENDVMEKRSVGVLHEILSLTIQKKTNTIYLRNLREELILPLKFVRIFTGYPGIFYLSRKRKTSTAVLKEGYHKGKVVDCHPLIRVREKFLHVMSIDVPNHQGKGFRGINGEDGLDKNYSEGEEEQEDSEEEQDETGDES